MATPRSTEDQSSPDDELASPDDLLDFDEKLAISTHFPSPIIENHSTFSAEQKIEYIAVRFREILQMLGLNLDDPSVKKTPFRIAKMYVQEVFSGLNASEFPKITFVNDKYGSVRLDNMVLIKVGFTSFCEHHFIPMCGTAFVAYVPNGKLIGLSKIARIVRFFCRRPQLQERLTAQIADSVAIVLNTDHVAVSMTATHFCVIARGIEDRDGTATTQVLRGGFKTDATLRLQFLEGIKRES